MKKQILFAIYKKNELVFAFISKDYNSAKLYFEGWLLDEEKIQDFTLYKLADIENSNLKEIRKIFITGGLENKYKSTKQMTLEFKKQIENQKEAEKEKETHKQLLKLFEGREIWIIMKKNYIL